MKRYAVVFDPNAMAEALEAADYIAGFSPDEADRWFAGLRAAVESLGASPAKCGRAREAETLAADLRQLLYRSYRIVFRIEEDGAIVRVLHVRQRPAARSGNTMHRTTSRGVVSDHRCPGTLKEG